MGRFAGLAIPLLFLSACNEERPVDPKESLLEFEMSTNEHVRSEVRHAGRDLALYELAARERSQALASEIAKILTDDLETIDYLVKVYIDDAGSKQFVLERKLAGELKAVQRDLRAHAATQTAQPAPAPAPAKRK